MLRHARGKPCLEQEYTYGLIENEVVAVVVNVVVVVDELGYSETPLGRHPVARGGHGG